MLSCFASREHRLFAELLYGTGMRLMEGLRLRVKDVEFERRAIVVREGKGAKDRVVMLPASRVPALREQLRVVRRLWQADRDDAVAGVQMPDALAPSTRAPRRRGAGSGSFRKRRATSIRAAASSAATMRSTRASSARSSARSPPPALTSRQRRTRCATRSRRTLLQAGYDIRTVQELLGHADVAGR